MEEPIVEELGVLEAPDVWEYTSYRKRVKRYPQDHWVRCIMCDWTGVVSMQTLDCPKCRVELIPPDEVDIPK